jgi:polysaccharide export outer membrane protein
MKLRGGDVLVVPRRKPMNVYVIGDVLGPGIYALPRWTQVTASQAMIYAGGPLPTASLGNSFVMRHDSNGERQAIPINFKEVLAGREPDFPIKADDIIFVPNSPVKTVTTGLLNMIPRLIQQWLIF